MGVRAPREEVEEPEWAPRPRIMGPPLSACALLAAVVFVLLVSNGRPIGAGDTRATERVAASIVGEGDLDLDEYPEVEPPFSRDAGSHRVSIYPVLSAVMAAPVFAAAGALFALDETGTALAGKVAAALFACLAAAALFAAVGHRNALADARTTAIVFAVGTTVWSTSQALWQHPAAVLFLSLALLCVVKAEHDPAWAGRAGLPLALMVAARHADVVIAAVLALGIAARWPRRAPLLVLWALPGVAIVLGYQSLYFGSPLAHGFSGTLGRFSEPWGVGHLGLLVSPAKGLLVFTPVVIVCVAGLVRAFRSRERWLAATLGAAAVGHWVLMGRWVEWHGGESWGPRMMTDVLPLLFLFLPEGIEVLGLLGALLAVVSIGVQALGAFAYDYRWERLHQRGTAPATEALWDVKTSPIAFYAKRGVLIAAMPAIRDGRAFVREHPIVLGSREGSRIRFTADDLDVTGSDSTLGSVHLQRGARVEDGRLRLRGRWDALFLRVLPGARGRRLELRVAGRGQGTLYVGERSFWSAAPRWSTHPVTGSFRIRHPYYYPESGGGDVTITVGKAPGEIDVEWVALVAPSDPDAPLTVPSSK
jgi:hypothetical protein